MDATELMLGRGQIVEFRGEQYVLESFDSSEPGMNRVTLRPTPRGSVDRWFYRPVIIDQMEFGEITPWKQ